MSDYFLSESPEGAHQYLPAAAAVLDPVLDPTCVVPVALLDAGELDPSLAGHEVLCLAYSTGAVDEFLVIEAGDDDKWMLVNVDGMEPEDRSRTTSWAESFPGGASPFADFATIESASLVESDDSRRHQKERGAVFVLGEPRWEQSPDPPSGDGWHFIAQIDSYYTHGSMYVFYDPATRRAHHLKQFT